MELDASLITLALNVLLAVFIFYGFLWGLGRGVVKSSIRLAYFVGFVIIVAIISPIITNTIIGIEFSFLDGKSLQDMIVGAITSSEGGSGGEFSIAALYESSPAMKELIVQLPAIFINLIIFLVLVYVSRIFSWIGYAITCRIHLKKKKRQQDGKFDEKPYTVENGEPVVLKEQPKPKKHRLFGALVGMAQGAILLFVTLLPITGTIGLVSNVVTDIVATQEAGTVSADVGKTTSKYPYIQKYVTEEAFKGNEDSFEEFKSYLNAYNSALCVGGFNLFGFNDACYNTMTTLKANGETFTLRHEINTLVEVGDLALYLVDVFDGKDDDGNDKELNWEKDIDFEKVDRLVDLVFGSGFVRTIGSDILVFTLSQMVEDKIFEDTGFDTELNDLVLSIKNNFVQDDKLVDTLKSDVKAIVGVAKAVCTNGIITLATADNVDSNALVNKLTDENCKVLREILNALLSSKTIQTTSVTAFNIALDSAEKRLIEKYDTLNSTNTNFDIVTLSKVKWTENDDKNKNVVNDICTIVSNVKEIVGAFEVLNENEGEDFATYYKDFNIKGVLENVGNILDSIKNAQFFNEATSRGNNLFNQFYDIASNVNDYSKYADFSKLKSISWVTEMGKMVDVIDFVLPLIAEGTEETDFKTIDYDKANTAFTSIFDSALFKTLKTSMITLLVGEDAEIPELLRGVYNQITTGYTNLSEMKGDFLAIINVAKIFGLAGGLDAAIDGTLSDNLKDVFTELKKVNEGETEMQVEKMVGELTNSKLARLLLIDLMNTSVLDSESEDSLGKIDKDASWEGWATFTVELKTILKNFITVYDNLGESNNFDSITEDISVLFNENFSETANALGTVLDTMAGSEFFRYKNESDVTISIYDNLIDKYIGDKIDIDSMKMANYTPNAWTNELNSLAGAVDKLNEKTVTTGEGTVTLLKYIMDGGDFTEQIKAFSNEDINVVVGGLLDSTIMKTYAVQAVNIIKTTIDDIIEQDPARTITEISDDYNLKAEKAQILAIVKAALPLQNATDLADNIENYEGDFKNLLGSLQSSKQYKTSTLTQGVFGDVYDAVNDVFAKAINDANIEVVKYVDDTYNSNVATFETDLYAQFDSIFGVVNAGIDLKDTLDTESLAEDTVENMLNNDNCVDSLDNLLVALQASKDYEYGVPPEVHHGVFADAYNALNTEICDTLNEKNADIMTQILSPDAYTGGDIADPATTDILSQFRQIVDIYRASLDLTSTSVDDILNDESNELQAVILALKTNADDEGVFATTYESVYNKLRNSINEANKALIEIVGPYNAATDIAISATYDDDLIVNDPQFDEIVNVFKKAIVFRDATDIDNVDDVTNNYSDQMKDLLTALKANATASGNITAENKVFYNAYNKLDEEFKDSINEANKGLIHIFDADYNTNVMDGRDTLDVYDDTMLVLKKALPLEDTANIDVIIDDDTKTNQFIDLFNELKVNANNDGVFSDAYDVLNTNMKSEINDSNKTLIQFVNPAYNTDVAGTSTDITENLDSTFAVLRKAKALTDIENMGTILINNRDDLRDVLKAMQSNYNITPVGESGLFVDAYTNLIDYLKAVPDDASYLVVAIRSAIKEKIAEREVSPYNETLTNYNWDEIFNLPSFES